MYIIDMKFGNTIKFSPVVALMLFICGAVVPVLSENTISIALCFVPFYGYAFFKCLDFSDKILMDVAERRRFYVINFLIFLVAAIASIVVGVEFISIALLINSVVSAVFSIIFATYAMWACLKSPDLILLFSEEIVE